MGAASRFRPPPPGRDAGPHLPGSALSDSAEKTVREALDPEAFAEAFDEGSRLELDLLKRLVVATP